MNLSSRLGVIWLLSILSVFACSSAFAYRFKVCNNTTLDMFYVAMVYKDLDAGAYSEGWAPVKRGACTELHNHHGPEVYLRIVGNDGTLMSVPRSTRDINMFCRSGTETGNAVEHFIYYREDDSGHVSVVDDPCAAINRVFCYRPEKTYAFFDSQTAMQDQEICASKYNGKLGAFQYYRLDQNNDRIIVTDTVIIK